MKVLISSRSFGKINSDPIDKLKDAGFEVVVNPLDKKLNENELIELIDDAVGLIAGTEPITESVLKQATSLKVISRYGVGLDNIDLDAANRRGVEVCNTPNAPAKAVAELTLSLILNIMRRIPESSQAMKERVWKPNMGNSLYGKTLGIVGLGRIGKELTKLVEPFNVEILAFEKYPDDPFIVSHNIKLVSLEDVLSRSDVVSIHLPLMEETFNIISSKELALMKRNSFLINTARGGLVDENALKYYLEKGLIAGAALDAFENEPYKGGLLDLDNVLLTPHIGTYTEETRMIMEIETVNNLLKVLAGVGAK
ncbi:phosphoglycerate dehydrogenase [Methanolobus psychrotolerans]|uniref:phosphoglycerate dehydrogenase n=1 Tax=Methanolobus psychrotolerans TaxID=1874706 RepID=UPI000B9170DD|nr:phosphoglycerate dehydrogenase [Methanolobus psychrotolerans]